MTRKIKFTIATLCTTGLLFVLPANKAYGEDVTANQPVVDPVPAVSGIATTLQEVQSKIDAASNNLQSTSQLDGNAIISLIQANNPNIDTKTAATIATSQEPIATSIKSASTKVQAANNAINAANAGVQYAQSLSNLINNYISNVTSSQSNVDSQTIVVANAQSYVDGATVTVTDAQNNLSAELAKLPDLQAIQTSAQSTLDQAYLKIQELQTKVLTAQANFDAVELALSSAPLTQTLGEVPGLVASVYRYNGGRSPSIANLGTPAETVIVPSIAYAWGGGEILGSGYSDGVIVVFSGKIKVPDTTDIYYAVYSDDGAQIYIDGQLAVNNWRDQGMRWSDYSQHYTVTPGQTQDITVFYYENGGGAGVVLGWGYNGIWTTPGPESFTYTGVTIGQPDPSLIQAETDARNALTSAQAEYNDSLAAKDTAYQALQDANNAVNIQQSVVDAAQSMYDSANNSLSVAQQNLSNEQSALQQASQDLLTKQQDLTDAQNNSSIAFQTANSLADTATVAVQEAINSMNESV